MISEFEILDAPERMQLIEDDQECFAKSVSSSSPVTATDTLIGADVPSKAHMLNMFTSVIYDVKGRSQFLFPGTKATSVSSPYYPRSAQDYDP